MALLKRTVRALDRIAPLSLAESWDNVGISSTGRARVTINLSLARPIPAYKLNSIFLTIDLTSPVLEEALAIRPPVGVIVAYHPVLFKAAKQWKLNDPKQRIALKCAASGVFLLRISIFSPHTALDSAIGGINDHLASLFAPNVKAVHPITPISSSLALSLPPPRPTSHVNFVSLPSAAGSGRMLTLAPPQSLSDIVQVIKSRLSLPHMRLARPFGPARLISSVAICAGSGASLLPVADKVDLMLTGEMSHHDLLAAQESGCAVLMCEHSGSERDYLNVLKVALLDVLKDDDAGEVNVVISKVDKDPVEFVS
ncbi:NGG1 interacting factor [Gonapodya sp. JEL0774]|nr:NGG1 interacting factor [Gonapodya sp. JEL0774]